MKEYREKTIRASQPAFLFVNKNIQIFDEKNEDNSSLLWVAKAIK